ncbi:MAG: hypothetical protein Q9216_003693 [Gyalolechia sp. 2 TL-2023]
MNEEAATQPQGIEKGPNKIEWRSRVDKKPLDMKEQFKDHFKLDEDVYYNGPRGSTGPFKVDEGERCTHSTGDDQVWWLTPCILVLGNGFYKLRGQDGEKIKKKYDEGDLSRVPKTI